MADLPQDIFAKRRAATLEDILLLVQEYRDNIPAPLVTDIRKIAFSRASAEREVWSLMEKAIAHLRNGAPGGNPGTISQALSKISLRSSSLAASLGVKPPQFEQIFFRADYSDGHEAAVFLCRRLIEAAEGDLSKSRQIISQKIRLERPELSEGFSRLQKEDLVALKKQMAHSLGVLLEVYATACEKIKVSLAGMASVPSSQISAPSFSPLPR